MNALTTTLLRRRATAVPLTQDETCNFVTTGSEFRARLLEAIDAAQEEILVETYILHLDTYGREILDALERACARGLRVRFIIDGFGSNEAITQELDTLRRSAVEFRVFHPLPWPLSPWSNVSWAQLPRFSRLFLKANKRDHRKVFVFDRRLAVLGSHNIWEECLVWNEASVFISGEGVDEVVQSWEMVWNRSYNLRLRQRLQLHLRERFRIKGFRSASQVLTNTSLRRKRWRYRVVYQSLRSARQRIWIVTPYLYPHISFLRLLNRKAREGVDVRILVPQVSDVPFERWLAQAIYFDLINARIKVFEIGHPILHAKVMLLDEQTIVGSSNFNHRSFHRDLEIDYYSREPQLLRAVETWCEDNFGRALHVSSAKQVGALFWKKCLFTLLRPIKTWF